MMRLVIGVDGGGSRTRVLVCDDNAQELVHAEGAGSAVQPGNAERSAAIIAAAVQGALEQVPDGDAAPRILCAGVAGTGSTREREALTEALAEYELAGEVLVRTDAEIGLEDAFGDGAGILLIAGTGSIAFGRGPTGVQARCGGWGPVCGDEGGGYWIGRRALSITTAALDGREPETALAGSILTMAESETPEGLVSWAAAATTAQIAALALVVIGAAERGDLRAESLLDLAAEELVVHLRSLARTLFQDERAACAVALSGGLLAPGAMLRRRVEHRLRSAVPGASVAAGEVRADRGAVKLALRHLGAVAPG
jgi:glucosamine kinase